MVKRGEGQADEAFDDARRVESVLQHSPVPLTKEEIAEQAGLGGRVLAALEHLSSTGGAVCQHVPPNDRVYRSTDPRVAQVGQWVRVRSTGEAGELVACNSARRCTIRQTHPSTGEHIDVEADLVDLEHLGYGRGDPISVERSGVELTFLASAVDAAGVWVLIPPDVWVCVPFDELRR